MTRPGSRERRRLEQETTPRRLPIGCMAWGAALGIIVGIMVALYALPPILRSIYGEKTIAHGEVYEADGKRIEVVSAARDGDQLVVLLRLRSNQAWATNEDDWQLEVSTQDDWLPALEPDPKVPGTDFALELAEERILVLRFVAPERTDAEPAELHLRSPRVGFRLRSQ